MPAYGPWVWDGGGVATRARTVLVGGGNVCAGLWLGSDSYLINYWSNKSFIRHVKGTVRPQIKSTCSAFHPSRLFGGELPSFGDMSSRAFPPIWNVISTAMSLSGNHDPVTLVVSSFMYFLSTKLHRIIYSWRLIWQSFPLMASSSAEL